MKKNKSVILDFLIDNYKFKQACNCNSGTEPVFGVMGESEGATVYEDAKYGELFFSDELGFEDKMLMAGAVTCEKCGACFLA